MVFICQTLAGVFFSMLLPESFLSRSDVKLIMNNKAYATHMGRFSINALLPTVTSRISMSMSTATKNTVANMYFLSFCRDLWKRKIITPAAPKNAKISAVAQCDRQRAVITRSRPAEGTLIVTKIEAQPRDVTITPVLPL